MRCTDVDRLASDYLDGELDINRSSALRGHLRECDRCRALVDDLFAVREMAQGLDAQMDPPPGLWNAIENELADSEIADAKRGPAWLWWQGVLSFARSHAMFAAAATAIVVTAVWIGQRRGADDSEGRTEIAVQAPTTFEASAVAVEPSHAQTAQTEMKAALASYQAAVVELLDVIKSAQSTWDADRRQTFERSLSRYEERIEIKRAQLMASSTSDLSSDVSSQDGLRDVYREQIEFLEVTAFGTLEGELELAAADLEVSP